jgi:hypothetical protein
MVLLRPQLLLDSGNAGYSTQWRVARHTGKKGHLDRASKVRAEMFLRIGRSDYGEIGSISVSLPMHDRMGGVSSPRVQGLD